MSLDLSHPYGKVARNWSVVRYMSWQQTDRKFSGAFTKLRKATTSFVMPVHPSTHPPVWNNSATTGQMFMKFDI
jgi:hypothetical protein